MAFKKGSEPHHPETNLDHDAEKEDNSFYVLWF